MRCPAGLSSNDIAAACKALGKSTQLAALKLGPPAIPDVGSDAQASQSGPWTPNACASLESLLPALPCLSAMELWGLTEAQLCHAQEAWQLTGRQLERSSVDKSGTRFALQSRLIPSAWSDLNYSVVSDELVACIALHHLPGSMLACRNACLLHSHKACLKAGNYLHQFLST